MNTNLSIVTDPYPLTMDNDKFFSEAFLGLFEIIKFNPL
jgi:hypothetical protein